MSGQGIDSTAAAALIAREYPQGVALAEAPQAIRRILEVASRGKPVASPDAGSAAVLAVLAVLAGTEADTAPSWTAVIPLVHGVMAVLLAPGYAASTANPLTGATGSTITIPGPRHQEVLAALGPSPSFAAMCLAMSTLAAGGAPMDALRQAVTDLAAANPQSPWASTGSLVFTAVEEWRDVAAGHTGVVTPELAGRIGAITAAAAVSIAHSAGCCTMQ